MSITGKRFCCPMTRRLASFSAALILLLPRMVYAGATEMVRSMDLRKDTSASAEKNDSGTLDLGLEPNGHLVFRCLDKSFTVARNSLEKAPALLEKVQSWKLQVEPTQSGLNVKVAYRF